eukprot:CAMPEP_0170497120 /NCGR_PEP_ID=MMETSP0208-20121228/23743_1 /TAXON_ID=197538 /ORGANISM="Strombidium inclinatum, Strain S3" /LENGTH=104 /DNA_ID=CAMNT_0010773831 /DNA_START=493 /DNA_END=808 /DNA_ORIENTATION=-
MRLPPIAPPSPSFLGLSWLCERREAKLRVNLAKEMEPQESLSLMITKKNILWNASDTLDNSESLQTPPDAPRSLLEDPNLEEQRPQSFSETKSWSALEKIEDKI